MRTHEIECWVLSAHERARSGAPVEDSRVEFKAKWPDPKTAARRIAGHANAARSVPVLWVIGVDEDTGEVLGAAREDLAAWWARVHAEFDEIAPSVSDLIVMLDGKPVVALVFATDRAPFLVKNPQGGTVQFEMPWRSATGIRTARRSELLRVLAKQQRLPVIEVLDARIYEYGSSAKEVPSLSLNVAVYVTPRDEERLVIPHHRCTVQIAFADGTTVETHPRRIAPPSPDSPLATRTATEVVLDGPSELSIDVFESKFGALPDADATVTMHWSPAGHDDAATVSAKLVRSKTKAGHLHWLLDGAPRHLHRYSRE